MKSILQKIFSSLILVLTLVFSTTSVAQVTNDKVNYQVRWADYVIRQDDQYCEAFASEDLNDKHDPPFPCAQGDEWVFECFVVTPNGTYETEKHSYYINSTYYPVDVNQNVKKELDVNFDAIDIRMASWEDDHGINSGYSSGDDWYGNQTRTHTFTSTRPCAQYVHNYTLPSNTNYATAYSVWRYNHGDDFADALTFGTINTGDTKTHNGRADSKPSWADNELGYTNQLDFNDDPNLHNYPDVCYKFTINSCQWIEIKNTLGGSSIDLAVVEMGSNNSFTYISTAWAGNTFLEYLDAGEYGIIVEGGTSNRNYNLQVKSLTIPAVTAGSINLFGPYAIPQGTNHPGNLYNVFSASNFSVYKWQRKPTFSSQWEDIPNTNVATYNLPVLNDTYEYRRCAQNVCGDVSCTSGIEIQALELNGDVDGYIETPGGQPVSDVTVTITNLEYVEGLGNALSFSKTATSNASGYFKISDFYVGPESTDWRITPSYPDHVFSPANTEFELSYAFPDAGPFTFVDESSFSFEGKVYHDFGGGECGFPGADIYLNGIYKTTTDQDGDYSVSIPQIDDHTVTVDFPDHTFDPPSISMYIDEDKTNQDFENTKYRTLDLSLLAGCDEFAGVAQIQITDTFQCINETYTTSGSGNLLVSLPAKELFVNVTEFTPITADPSFSAGLVTAFFDAMNIKIDLRQTDTVLDLVYHPTPVLEISGIPDPPSCGFAYPVVEQFTDVLVELTAYDYPPEVLSSGHPGCLLDTASLHVIDYLTSPDENPRDTVMPVSNGLALYHLRPLSAALAPPHTKSVEFLLSDDYGNLVLESESIFVDGSRPRTGTFTTVSPQIPLFVIHDPPGDISYSQILQNTTINNTYSISNGYGGSFKAWAKAKTEQEYEIIQTKYWGEIGGSISVGRDNISSTQSSVTSSFTQSFGTASDESLASIYQNGDVYVGAAFNILYAVNDIIQFDPNRCEVKLDKKLMISPDTFNTTYVWTHGYIKNQLIPTLREDLANGVVDPDSIKFFEDQAAIWEQIIENNEENQRKASYSGNYSFDGAGGAISETYQTTNVESTSFEWTANLDFSIAGELGLLVGGVGGAAGFETQLRLNWGESTSSSTANTTSTNFVLDDNNAGDIFSVSVGKDPVYATPIFNLEAANTSCPHEPNTLPRYDAVLTVDQPVHANVDPEDPVTLVFTVFNQSQSEEDLYYLMRFNVESNPDGALINGTPNPVDWVFNNTIPYGGSVQQTVTIEKGAGNVYGYENLEFLVYPNCNDFNSVASQKVSVYFETPCTDVNINAPEEGWVASEASSNMLPIHLTDYVVSNMDALSIQYTPSGSNSWVQAVNVPLGSLNPNSTVGTTVNWNTTYVEDGEYSIRAKIVCGSDVIYTQRIPGKIDQTSPKLYGRPLPVDHAYTSVSEEIRMQFSEQIDCTSLNNGNLTLHNLLSGNEVAIDFVCHTNEVVVEPLVDLLNLAPSVYKLIAINVADQYGNTNQDSITWEFSAGNYTEFTCDESTIYYVDKSAIYGARNGLSWKDAFTDLMEALNTACPGSSIYVAEGTYHPWDSIPIINIAGDTINNLDTMNTEEIAFKITHDYNLFGGFPSGGGDFEDRKPAVYPTVLSGDKNGNSAPDAFDSHSVLHIKTDVESLVDGFVFQDAYADAAGLENRTGAGVYDWGHVHYINCIFRDLHATGDASNGVGAAVVNFAGDSKFSNCLFYDNEASSNGGAISSEGGSVSAYNCTFTENTAPNGAGVHLYTGSYYSHNSIFFNNSGSNNPNINVAGSGIAIADYCLFDSAIPPNVPGLNNILNSDPDFEDSASDIFELSMSSPAIDAGNITAVQEEISKDLKGNSRFMDAAFSQAPIVDMGAYEYSPCASLAGLTSLFVDPSSAGTQEGDSWTNAVHSLSTALEKCKACQVDTVRVAEGVYKPNISGLVNPEEASFNIFEGLTLLGGFPSGGSDLTGRDPEAYMSELNGYVNPDYVHHVMTIANAGDDVLVDGFTVRAGQALDGTGDWTAVGGGLLILAEGVNKECSPTIQNCRFEFNEAIDGGGVAIVATNKGISLPQFNNCSFEHNSVVNNGGAVYEQSEGAGTLNFPKFVNCLFAQNEADQSGGAMYTFSDSSGQAITDLINCTIVDNDAINGHGGGAYAEAAINGNSTQYVANSILWANSFQGMTSTQIETDTNSSVYLRYSILQDENTADTLVLADGVIDQGNNDDNMPVFTDVVGGDYSLKYGSDGINDGLSSVNVTPYALNRSDRIIGSSIDRGAYEFDYVFPCGTYGTLTLDDNPVLSAEYKAIGQISSDGTINAASNGNVIFNSTSSILLDNGFLVEEGTEFEAIIENPCVD